MVMAFAASSLMCAQSAAHGGGLADEASAAPHSRSGWGARGWCRRPPAYPREDGACGWEVFVSPELVDPALYEHTSCMTGNAELASRTMRVP